MRIKTSLIALLCTVAICFGISGLASLTTETAYAESWTPTVEGGVLDERVPFGHNGGTNGNAKVFGSKLIPVSEDGVNRGWYELQLAGGWGSRYTFDYQIDVRNADIVLDLTNMNNDGYIGLILGAGKGNYFNAEYGGFGIKICAHNNQFGIVISNVIHQASIETIMPAPQGFPWDSGNTGYVVTAAERILNLSFRQSGADEIAITVNGNTYVVPVEEFTKILGNDLSKIYLMAGAFGDAKEIVRIKLKDANSEAYEKKLPEYVASVTAYETAANADLTKAENILAAESAGRNVAIEGMRNYDLAYYGERLTATSNKVAEARKALSKANLLTVFASDVQSLKTMISSVTDNAGIASAESMAKDIDEKDVAVIENGLTDDLKAKFNQIKTEYENALTLLEQTRKNVVLSYVSVYEQKIKTASSAADVYALVECREAINENLKKLSSSDKSEIGLKLVEYADKLEKITALKGWTKSNGSVVYTDGNTFELFGQTAYNDLTEERNGSTLTYSQTVKANKFSIDLNITKQSMALFENWIGISITRTADNFYYATDATNEDMTAKLQSNPGIAITLEKRAGNKLYVELFMIKTTQTSIYSASRGQMLINFNDGDPLNITIDAEDDVNATYAKVYFNGELFSGTQIKNSEIKGALKGFEGYLSFSFANPGSSIKVNKINGAKAVTPAKANDGSATDDPSSGSSSNSGQSSEKPDDSSSGKKGCGSNVSADGIALLSVCAAFSTAVVLKKRRING